MPKGDPGLLLPEEPSGGDEKAEESGPSPLVLLLVVAVLVVGGYFLAVKLRDVGRLQDCLMQGRTNCAPISRGSSP